MLPALHCRLTLNLETPSSSDFPPHVHVRNSQELQLKGETNTRWPVRFTFTMRAGHYSSHTQYSGDRPTLHTEFFLIWMGVFSKIVFWPWDRRARQQAGWSWFCARQLIVNCIYANPSSCSHTGYRGGERQATLKTLSKNGKALFNFTNKIILKSLCQLFACDLIMEEYVTIYG